MRDIRGLLILPRQVHRSPTLFAPHFYKNFGHPKSNHQRNPRYTRTHTSYHSLNFHHKPPTSAEKESRSWEPKEPKEGNKGFEIGISSKMNCDGMLLRASGWLLIYIADSSILSSRIPRCAIRTLIDLLPRAPIHSDQLPTHTLLPTSSQLTHPLHQTQALSKNFSTPTNTGLIPLAKQTRTSWRQTQKARARPSSGSAVPTVVCPKPPSSAVYRAISSYIAILPISCTPAT